MGFVWIKSILIAASDLLCWIELATLMSRRQNILRVKLLYLVHITFGDVKGRRKDREVYKCSMMNWLATKKFKPDF